MRVMAVCALHQTFVHAMVEGPGELLLLVEVAAVAKQRLLFLHEKLALFGVVGIVAVCAADIVLQMRRAAKITVLFAVLVTIEATCADVRGGSILKRENLCLVPAALHVRFPGPVAGFAAMPFRPLLGIQRGHKVRRCLVVFVEILRRHVLVAGLAGL